MVDSGTLKITVLMPVYNGEKYLQESIDSILNQSYSAFEFLIIDDGSNDNTVGIIEEYQDERICLVQNEHNLGIAATLNKGITMSRCEYIARMDSDDVAHVNRLSEQLRFMDDNPDVAVCGSLMDSVDNPQIIYDFPCGEIVDFHLLYGPPVAHPSAMIRKSVLVQNGFFYDETIKYAQDYDLWSRVSKAARITNIPQVLMSYRTHSGQVSQCNIEEQNFYANSVRRMELSFLGIFVTDSDLAMHVQFFRCSTINNSEMVEFSKQWVCKLLEANAENGKFDPDIFRRYLLRKLWAVFSCSSSLGMHTLMESFEYHFWGNKICSTKELIYFLVKCLSPRVFIRYIR